uniref:Uncharacterized protein n=1 Tax=Lepeophtheirus salmonis TaxID=72036 RepID=A0A0K2TWA4_LEPSM
MITRVSLSGSRIPWGFTSMFFH